MLYTRVGWLQLHPGWASMPSDRPRAADVAQTVFFFIDSCGLAEHMAAHQQFAAIWAALAHDVVRVNPLASAVAAGPNTSQRRPQGHTALTNPFLVRSGDPLAIRYNDKCVVRRGFWYGVHSLNVPRCCGRWQERA